jgi:hypothetical protein
MSVTTLSPRRIALTEAGPVVEPLALPDLDPAVADALGDDILLSSAASERTRKVAGRNGDRFQSHTARAWTKGGQVD